MIRFILLILSISNSSRLLLPPQLPPSSSARVFAALERFIPAATTGISDRMWRRCDGPPLLQEGTNGD